MRHFLIGPKSAHKASKVAGVIGNETAADLSRELFDTAVLIADRDSFFELLRVAPEKIMEKALLARHQYLFTSCPGFLRSNIIHGCVVALLQKKCYIMAAQAVLNVQNGFLNTGMLPEDDVIRDRCQTNLLQAVLQGIVMAPQETFLQITTEMGKMVPKTTEGWANIQDGKRLTTTINPSNYVDWAVIVTLGKALQEKEKKIKHSRDTVEFAQRLETIETMMSTRLRSMAVVDGGPLVDTGGI